MNVASATSSDSPQWFKVDWFWAGEGDTPRRGVFIETQSGLISDITPTTPAKFVDLGPAAILPSLANPHCHLEFSDLSEPLSPPLPFADWIGKTVAARRNRTDWPSSIQSGLQEVNHAGVGLLAEIVTQDDLSVYPETTSPLLMLFREFLAFDETQAAGQLQTLKSFLSEQKAGTIRGISPHAPYTVCLADLENCVALAREFQTPLMMHLAETQAELEFLYHQTGELVDMLKRIDLWRPERYEQGVRPLHYLQLLDANLPCVIAHGNYLDDEEISFLARRPHFSVAYCPRTHAYFEHRPHPWQKLAEAGVNVTLGTDGRGSNPDLDIWKDAQFVKQQQPDANSRFLVQMATVNAGRALGQDLRLRIGQPARWTVVSPAGNDLSPFSDWDALLLRQTRRQSVIMG
ncbi:MAG: amidohydrolase family protein [Rubinisphaera brasiliensis]|uniref:amidohydrolase family protein n=1 Tax=Rubinisphaera brasiliensis TaxID=119 RepID=UPI00391ABBAD